MEQNITISSNTANEKISKVLIRFAWLIEGFAVATGLAISVMVGIDTYNKNLEITGDDRVVTNATNVVIAALPFLMVSVVELAKIPVAQAVYATRQIFWRFLFFLMLLFLAGITFETALNGFERNYNNLNYQVSAVREKLEALDTRVEVVTTKIEKAKGITRELVILEFDRQNKIFTLNRESEFGALQSAQSLANTTTVSAAIQAEIDDLNEKRDQLIKEKDSGLAKLQQSRSEEINASKLALNVGQEQVKLDAADKRKVIDDELKRAVSGVGRSRKELDRAKNTRAKAIKDSKFWNVSGIKKEQNLIVKEAQQLFERAQKIESSAQNRLLEFSTGSVVEDNLSKLNLAVSSISLKYDSKSEKLISDYSIKMDLNDSELAKKRGFLLEKIGLNKADIDKERNRLAGERGKIQSQYNLNLDKISVERDRQFDVVDERETVIAGHELELSNLADQAAVYKSIINVKASDNQVYRIAMMFAPDAATAADVPRGTVDMVGKVWFGSLAMLIAITGILLALASEVVKDPKQTSVKGNSSISATFRRLLVDIRKRQRKPKIIERIIEKEVERIVHITKEIPVDKVVLKEVVVEVIKKEIVHVPVYSDDPDLINNPKK
jgi:hypothetical protein|tara:strand:+ start:720 stop:2552 length:1833 start_codon:yes stop_codon:yes gene_type:complete